MKLNFKKCIPVMASDGFLPPDIVRLCSKNSIKGIVQPGGSKNDQVITGLLTKIKSQWFLQG